MTRSTLPERARAKIAAIEDAAHQATTLANSTKDRISQYYKALNINPHGENAVEYRAEIDRLENVLRQQQTLQAQRTALDGHIRTWLAQLPASAEIEDAKPIKVKRLKDESIFAAITRTRSEIATLESEKNKVATASLPRDYQKAMVRQWVKRRGTFANPNLRVGDTDVRLAFGTETFNEQPTVADILCWLDPDGMARRLEQQLDDQPRPKVSLTPDQRAERLDEIKTAMFELERIEEKFIELAEGESTFVPRRPSASAEAILGIIVNKRKSVAA